MDDVLSRLRSALAGRYTLERELGRGGMATVWLAEEHHPRRHVALKVLDPTIAQVLGPDRFLREVDLAAKLTHPHILPIHTAGEAAGLLYYAMPYVEGESLRDRLNREKQLPLDDALQIAREVADALSYAHSHDVVHRDIKPENILLESGHAVVADFGIARAITAAGGEKLTETGIAVGTPAYMSPEQGAGSRELDGRSDLYSLGCVLYEMLAGRPPFVGPTVESVVHQHLAAEPPSITSLRPAVPASVVAALSRALAKTPADRFNPVALFGEALRVAPTGTGAFTPPISHSGQRRLWRIGAVAAAVVGVAAAGVLAWRTLGPRSQPVAQAGTRRWVVVADFTGTADPPLRHMAREIVAAVFDQSTVWRALPPQMTRRGLELMLKPETTAVIGDVAREIAVRGQVSRVVSGELNQAGSAFSVVLRVLDPEAGMVVVAEQARAGSEDDLIAAVEQAAIRLRRGLGERQDILEAERPIADVMTASSAAYSRYVAGVRGFLSGRLTNRQSLQLHLEAVALDPAFASAWRSVGVHYSNLGVRDSARFAIDRALSLEGRLTESQLLWTRGMDANLRHDYASAVQVYDELVRRYGEGHNNLGGALGNLGHHRAAVDAFKRDGGVFGPSPLALDNMAHNLRRHLGALDEAAEWTARLTGMRRWYNDVEDAMVRGHWQRAESLAAVAEQDPTMPMATQQVALVALASTRAIRGEMRAADTTLAAAEMLRRAEGRDPALLCRHEVVVYRLVSRQRGAASACPVPSERLRDSSALGLVLAAFHALLSGDTATGRDRLRRARLRPPDEFRQVGIGPPLLLEGWVAAAASRWDSVVSLVAPLAQTWPSATGRELRVIARLLTAEAYDHLNRPDSAAGVVELLASPQAMADADLPLAAGLTYSFAHQRLVVLYARMGRLEDARRHWKIFSEAFTNPDPEVRHLIDEARAALAEAERRGG